MSANSVWPWRQFVVTGAGGWIGRNALDLLAGSAHTKTIAFAAQPRRVRAVHGDVDLLPMASLPDVCLERDSLLLLCGFPTQDQVDVMGTSAYLAAIDNLRRTTLGVLNRGPMDVVYLSSGAATSVENGADVPQRTQIYGEAKLADEQAYRNAVVSRGGRICVVRAFALSGPYMTKPATYALGNMILQAMKRGRVEVKATRPVRRSYMAIDDMLEVALSTLSARPPDDAVTFETAGEVVEVGELAGRVLGALGLDPAGVERPAFDAHAPADDYLGAEQPIADLAAQAGVSPAGLERQIAATSRWLREATK